MVRYVCGRYRVLGLELGESEFGSGACESDVMSRYCGEACEGAVPELLAVEEVDKPEDCVLRLGVIVILLFLLGLYLNIFSGRSVAVSVPSWVAVPSRRSCTK